MPVARVALHQAHSLTLLASLFCSARSFSVRCSWLWRQRSAQAAAEHQAAVAAACWVATAPAGWLNSFGESGVQPFGVLLQRQQRCSGAHGLPTSAVSPCGAVAAAHGSWQALTASKLTHAFLHGLAEIGLGLTAFGVLFGLVGIIFFFDRGLIAMGNVGNRAQA